MKIMIVEDEMIIAEDLKYTLESLGHEITYIAASGEMAIQFAELERPDMIFMDIMLDGDINGIQAAMLIKRKNNIPIIFCSSNGDMVTKKLTNTMKPIMYIPKPVEEWKIQVVLKEFEHFGKCAV